MSLRRTKFGGFLRRLCTIRGGVFLAGSNLAAQGTLAICTLAVVKHGGSK